MELTSKIDLLEEQFSLKSKLETGRKAPVQRRQRVGREERRSHQDVCPRRGLRRKARLHSRRSSPEREWFEPNSGHMIPGVSLREHERLEPAPWYLGGFLEEGRGRPGLCPDLALRQGIQGRLWAAAGAVASRASPSARPS